MGWTGRRDGDVVLTEVENRVEREQQRRDCMNCRHLEYVGGSGARECLMHQDPKQVLCGRVKCEYWEKV